MTNTELEALEARILERKRIAKLAVSSIGLRDQPHPCTDDEALSLIARIRKLETENEETRQGYDADVRSLCESLWKREPGCEFVRLNYPQIAAALEEVKP